MPPKRTAKQNTASDDDTDKTSTKRTKIENGSKGLLREPHTFAAEAEEHGIVLRKYYPPEMSNARAQAYNDNGIPRPIEQLETALEQTASARRHEKVKDAVIHWFKTDLRTKDNRALWEASQKAQEADVPLICIYILSPEDFEAHLTAPIRVDYVIRTLRVLKEDLEALDIPLYVETVERRKDIPERVLEFMEEWGASHLYTNIEYEVDELRREAKMVKMCAEKGLAMFPFHDSCIVPPGSLHTGAGKQYAVYSPWFRAWVAHLHSNQELLSSFDPPSKNTTAGREKVASLFDCEIPENLENKKLSEGDAKRYRATWPAGEREALDRLDKFCEEKIAQYSKKRNFPSEAATSSISVHLAVGTLSARTAVRTARDRNKTKKLDAGVEGIQSWISEGKDSIGIIFGRIY